jgi:hypothetical protein
MKTIKNTGHVVRRPVKMAPTLFCVELHYTNIFGEFWTRHERVILAGITRSSEWRAGFSVWLHSNVAWFSYTQRHATLNLHLFTEGSKSNIPCRALLALFARNIALDSRMTHIRRESGTSRKWYAQNLRTMCVSHVARVSIMQMLRAPVARGARNKGCYFWTPLYVLYMQK